ncbi:MAG: Mur ligase family protein [Candidatus Roizmanbacteria bacterium]|nr:Mur ligase family protein [Candidatus Roizmanbacteria bacterium]
MKTFDEAVEYMYSTIPQTRKTKFPAHLGLLRMKRIMELLGNPQNKLRIIHIAGTSGKGSTATFVSSLLSAHGKKTGLHVKPHFVDIRERLQINGQMIAKKSFVAILQSVRDALKHLETARYGSATYFEILVAIAYVWFYEERVDYAVIETGVGGLFDGTNVVERTDKVCLLTKIGLDHTSVLGKTTKAIAAQKTGIIYAKNVVFSCDQSPTVQAVFTRAAQKNKASLSFVTNPTSYNTIQVSPLGTFFRYMLSDSYVQYALKTIGYYQAQNASLALAGVEYVSKRDAWTFSHKTAQNIFAHTTIPGRFETINYKKKLLILDSAHNPQKMKAFVQTLSKVYQNKKITYCIAVKNDKNSKIMLRYCLINAQHIVLTEFAFETMDIPQISSSANDLYLKISDEMKSICIKEPNQKKALEKAIALSSDIVVVTGSMYLLAAIKRLLLH